MIMIDSAENIALTKDQYLTAYKNMLLFRRFEEKSGQLYGNGMIGGFCHLYIGQEAVIAGVLLAKKDGDSMVTSYRDHAHIMGVGTPARNVLAELMGKSSGCSKGKGGSMHMFDIDNKFYGGHGIVGAQVPIGTGIAFADKYRETGNVCYTFFGDGAVNQGQVYEAFNIAALWGIPVVYIIENNQYSMGTSVARSTAMTDLYRKGESFGISGISVDGMSLEDVYNAVSVVSKHVRDNSVPYIIEMKTYRYRGHSMSDPAKYRTKDEVDNYKTRDPLHKVKNAIIELGYLDDNGFKAIDKDKRYHSRCCRIR
jgi:pyruvate dehydrogenase E1 component alpha subunit